MAIVPKAELEWLRTVDPRLFTRAHRDRLFEHIDALEESRDSFVRAFAGALEGAHPEPSMGEPIERKRGPLHGDAKPHPYARGVPGPHRFVRLTEADFDAMSNNGTDLP